jgi:hypothetical protein
MDGAGAGRARALLPMTKHRVKDKTDKTGLNSSGNSSDQRKGTGKVFEEDRNIKGHDQKKEKLHKVAKTESNTKLTPGKCMIDTGWKGGELPPVEDFFGTFSNSVKAAVKSDNGPKASKPHAVNKTESIETNDDAPEDATTAPATGKRKRVNDEKADFSKATEPNRIAKKGSGGGLPAGAKDGDDDRLERTVFVGSVKLHAAARRDLRRLFSACGTVESVRLRSIPTDNSAIPKKACIALGPSRAERHSTG